MKYSLPFFALIFFAGCASVQTVKEPSTPTEKLQTTLSQMFNDSNFVNAHWGVLIKSLRTGETLYAQNEKKMFMPASNMKLFATASVLSALSPDFQYRTVLTTNGTISNGVLNGNIIMHGSGDPSIATRFTDSNATKVFEQWADSLKAKGITSISGNLIGDDNCFDEENYGEGWSADYETDYYAAQISGISYNDNCIDVTLTADSVAGNPCVIALSPKTQYVIFINKTKTVPQDSGRRIWFSRKRGTNIVTIEGTLPQNGKEWIESVTVDNPTLYALTVMKEVFISKGISVNGNVVDIDDLQSVPDTSNSIQLASYLSPSLSEIAAATNKPSQNLYAEQLFRTIGFQKLGIGSMEKSKQFIYPTLSSWGVDTVRLRASDASGLSRLDLITPSDIVSILTGMYNGPYRTSFYESLPIAGVDGSIKGRMKGTKAEGNVHAKTGFIGYVRSLSGYVTSSDGEPIVFCMIANNYTVPTRLAEKIQNDVCVMLAEFQRTMNTSLN
ncbi:MAG: D-alanyl-D-alanine carboxypeptidase/D-alanyl-D-alanine-endopeptidase [Bacteroidetes bacterium]|nr:D-alanyl-D-alanine carboxypeptidase/D-alanyl-D-alanine-endopeptidase [Bacteroidota bacterium]